LIYKTNSYSRIGLIEIGTAFAPLASAHDVGQYWRRQKT
jgi:hypothetical protein